MIRAFAKLVQSGLQRAFGVHITRKLPRGVDPLFDIKHYLSKTSIDFVVDVGAHFGIVASEFRQTWPNAEIHSFEPSQQNFDKLSARVAGKRIHTHRIALGDKDASGVIEIGIAPDLNMVDETRRQGETVELRRLDTLFKTEHINFLKIDAEGSDLKVLHGATQLLAERRIDIIELEAGVRRSRRLVPFGDFQEFLEPYGYHLFGFYEQVGDWARGWHRLRRANLVFVSEPTMLANAWKSEYQHLVEVID